MQKFILILFFCGVGAWAQAQNQSAPIKVVAIDSSLHVTLEVFLPAVFEHLRGNASQIKVRFRSTNPGRKYFFNHSFQASDLIRSGNGGRLRFKTFMPMGNYTMGASLSGIEAKFVGSLNTSNGLKKLANKPYKKQIRFGEATSQDYNTSQGQRTRVMVSKLSTEGIKTMWLIVVRKGTGAIKAQYFGKARRSWKTPLLARDKYKVLAVVKYHNGVTSGIRQLPMR